MNNLNWSRMKTSLDKIEEIISNIIISEKDLPLKDETVCTIGNFDGLHIGHKEIIKKLKEEAQKEGKKSVVITFNPHPKKIFSSDKHICSITNLETRAYLFAKEGINYVLVINFDKNFYKKSPEDFLKFLKEKVRCTKILVGKDWKFGYKKSGDVKLAKQIGKKLGFEVEEIEPIQIEKHKVSSTEIRSLLKEGKLEEAEKLLGRTFCILGKVQEGNKLGQRIGIPTINIKPPEDFCLKKGVYAGYAIINEKRYPAVINYGIRPTVDGKEPVIEVHIIGKFEQKDFNLVKVMFKKFLRPEMKFNSLEDLTNQIKKDIIQTKEVLKIEEN